MSAEYRTRPEPALLFLYLTPGSDSGDWLGFSDSKIDFRQLFGLQVGLTQQSQTVAGIR